jgi:hypothetical protein
VKIWAVLALLAASVTAKGQAAETTFSPPLDQPLRYETLQEKISQGRVQRISSTAQLEFSRDGAGYGLRWQTGEVQVEAPPPSDLILRALMKVAVSIPLVLTVAETGEMTGVRDIQRWRTARTAMLKLVLKSFDAMPQGASARNALSGFVTAQNGQTDEQIAQELTDTPSYITIGGLVGLSAGEEVSSDIEMPLSIGNGTIATKMVFRRAADTEDGLAHLTILSAPESADVMKQLIPVLEQMFSGLPAGPRAKALEELGSTDVTIEERTDILYDPRTGVSSSVIQTKRIDLGKLAQRVDRLEMKLLRAP